MIAYTVTCEFVNPAAAEDFARWLVREHVDVVCAFGAVDGEVVLFEGSPPTCEARYHFASRLDFEAYERDHAPRLRAEAQEQLGDTAVIFRRTIGELVEDPMNVTAPWRAI